MRHLPLRAGLFVSAGRTRFVDHRVDQRADFFDLALDDVAGVEVPVGVGEPADNKCGPVSGAGLRSDDSRRMFTSLLLMFQA